MIWFVLNDPGKLIDVLEVWEKAGVTGVTIIESTGMHRVQRKMNLLRSMPGYFGNEENHVTLTAIVEQEDLIKTCREVAESVVGDLAMPKTGIFAAWPLHCVKGYEKLKE